MNSNVKNLFLVVLLFVVSCTEEGAGWKVNVKSNNAYTNCKITDVLNGSVSITGFPRNANRLPSTGTVNATVILVDFPDAPASLTPAQAYALISDAADTFDEMSYGRMQYTMTPRLQWYRMSQNSTAYTLGTYDGHKAYIQEAVSLADADVDFSQTDSLVILANPNASGIGSSGPAMSVSPGSGITADGNEMINNVTSAYDLNTWGSIWLNHEVTHTLGLVDLYDYGWNSSTSWDLLHRFAGFFSYMGYNSLTSNAPGLTAWERWVLGWIDDDQIICANPLIDGEINQLITPVEETGGTKAVVVPLGATSVLVVESRRAQGIDENMEKEGALVYVIDSSISSGRGALQVYPINTSDPHYVQSIRSSGESAKVSIFKVAVVSSSSQGDTVRIIVE